MMTSRTAFLPTHNLQAREATLLDLDHDHLSIPADGPTEGFTIFPRSAQRGRHIS